MVDFRGRRPSEWQRLFLIAADLIDQLREKAGGHEFEWSFGGGTAMMIQIGHRESHDIDIFLDDPQLLGFIDPSRSQLSFSTIPAAYGGDGMRFQRFAFEDLGEIDFIVAGALTKAPFEKREVEGPPGISGSCRSNKGAACKAESGVRQTDDRTAHDHAGLCRDG